MEEIGEITKKENISEIVIGESKNFAGEPNKIMSDINKFKDKLESELNLPVNLEPEFLTSVQAKKFTGENKMHDASAAAIILQSFLDSHVNNL